MRFPKEKMAGSSSSSRKRPYGLLLVLALGMAVMCAAVLHQLREGRVLSLLLQERDQQLHRFQLLMQKERENLKEMKRKLDDMKAKTFTLRNQKMELTDKLLETRNSAAQLKKLRTELEAALMEKQIQVDKLTDKTEKFMLTKLEVANLTVLLKQKEAEVEEMKKGLTKQDPVENSTAQNKKSQHESFSEERKGEWDKFKINMVEVGLKAENVSRVNEHEAAKRLSYTEQNQTFGVKEANGAEDGKGDAKATEETDIQMKGSESNREIDEQFKSPDRSEMAAKNESAVIEITKDDKMIRSSSAQIQRDLTQKTFSIDTKSTAKSESSDRNISSSKKVMERDEQVRDNMGDEKKDKPEDDQRETKNEKSEVERGSSSKDLQLQENKYSEAIQSSQENGNSVTETVQKEAIKKAKFIR